MHDNRKKSKPRLQHSSMVRSRRCSPLIQFKFLVYMNSTNTVFDHLLTVVLMYYMREEHLILVINMGIVCVLKYIYCVILSMYPASKWMWTHDLGTLQFYIGDIAVIPCNYLYREWWRFWSGTAPYSKGLMLLFRKALFWWVTILGIFYSEDFPLEG